MRPSRPSCPLIDSPLAQSPLGASILLHTFRSHTSFGILVSQSPVATKIPIEFCQTQFVNFMRQYYPPVLAAHRSSLEPSSPSQPHSFFCLGSSLVPFSQSLLLLVHLSHSFTVPHLCTNETRTLPSSPLDFTCSSWV